MMFGKLRRRRWHCCAVNRWDFPAQNIVGATSSRGEKGRLLANVQPSVSSTPPTRSCGRGHLSQSLYRKPNPQYDSCRPMGGIPARCTAPGVIPLGPSPLLMRLGAGASRQAGDEKPHAAAPSLSLIVVRQHSLRAGFLRSALPCSRDATGRPLPTGPFGLVARGRSGQHLTLRAAGCALYFAGAADRPRSAGLWRGRS